MRDTICRAVHVKSVNLVITVRATTNVNRVHRVMVHLQPVQPKKAIVINPVHVHVHNNRAHQTQTVHMVLHQPVVRSTMVVRAVHRPVHVL